jgi:hypothetical protein
MIMLLLVSVMMGTVMMVTTLSGMVVLVRSMTIKNKVEQRPGHKRLEDPVGNSLLDFMEKKIPGKISHDRDHGDKEEPSGSDPQGKSAQSPPNKKPLKKTMDKHCIRQGVFVVS